MTAITVNAHREKILQRLEGGAAGGYEFLTLALPFLEAVPGDQYVRLMAIRESLKLGLVLPARELAYANDSEGELSEELENVCRSVVSLKGEAIPWSGFSDRFETNLKTMADRGVDSAAIRDAWNAASNRYQLFLDRRGVFQVRKQSQLGVWSWFPRLADHPNLENVPPLPEGLKGTFAGPFLIEGIELGWYLQRLYEATTDTFVGYSCPLFMVEPDLTSIAIAFHLHDWSRLLRDPRVYWFTGDDWRERLAEAWQEDLDLALPVQAFRFREAPADDGVGAFDIVHEAATARDARVTQSLGELEERYAARDRAYWAKRFDEALSGRGAPLRLLAGVSTHTTFLQYSMRDARRAFESLGHQLTVLTEPTSHHVIGPLTYHQAIRELDPDVFFNIDHIRPEFGSLIPSGLPVLTWDQDQLPQVFTTTNLQKLGPLDFVAGYSKLAGVLAGCNPKQFLHARVPTCPEQFSGEPLTDSELRKYSCDVSYVSHASQTPQAFHEEERGRVQDPRLAALLDTLFELTPPMLALNTVMGNGVPDEILDEGLRRCELPALDKALRDRLTGWYLWRLGDRLFRHEALEWVADWARRRGRTLRIYGNGWGNHPTLARYAAGGADNGRELLCIYRASKINLQLMPAGFVHQRALDGLAAGGFFLSRQTPNDLRGHLLRPLLTRMDELNIDSTRSLLQSTDHALQSLLDAYGGDWLQRVDSKSDQLFHNLHILSEETQPAEVFENFEQILFDSPTRFAELADSFHADDQRRSDIVKEMREGVIQHYSYQSTMNRFLHAMRDFFKGDEA